MAPRPGSPEYNRLYGAGGGRGVYAVRPPLTRSVPGQSAAAARAAAAKAKAAAAARARAAAAARARAAAGSRTGTTTGAGPATGGNPWDSFLNQIDAREKAARDEALSLARNRSLAYQSALAGFGGALQQNAVDLWGRVVGGYNQGGAAADAHAQAAAGDYRQGLERTNQQLATDFAAIGQSGDPNVRDTDAATAQVATVGGTNPGATMGLVGQSWGRYGETRPGELGFMTGQNIMQAGREGQQAEAQIASEFAAAMADNPQQAMAMWQASEEWKGAKTKAKADAAQMKFENALMLAKNAREAQAAELLAQQFNLKYGAEFAKQADKLSDQTGFVYIWNPKTGKFENTGQHTVAWNKAQTDKGKAAETVRHNKALEANDRVQNGLARARIGVSKGTLKVAQAAERRLGLSPKEGGYSDSERRQLGTMAANLANTAYNGGDTTPEAADTAFRQMLAAQIPYSIAYRAMVQFAKMKGSKWKHVLGWNKASSSTNMGPK